MPKRTVLVCGTFDILHPGHLSFFENAKKYGSELFVLVARDSNIRKIKRRKPFFNERERLEMVSSLAIVDFAFLGDRMDFFKGVASANPSVLVLGFDQRNSAGAMLGIKSNASAGEIESVFAGKGLKMKVVLLERGLNKGKYSSSAIKNALRKGRGVLSG
ncbi:TPA: adenylyltransferase/cytidyltransferase family protein [Candidatus Micrarchaeota archaeon]|nr:adenylyltransferase/cytidyltransferase family protein [Candidatus Micrarchaeota archaeon]